MSEKERRMKIDVEVDSKAFQELAEKNADLKNKLKLSAERLLEYKKERYGVPEELTDIEDVKAWIEENNAQPRQYSKSHSKPSDVVGHGGVGNMPLSHNLYEPKSEGYESHEALVFDIMDKASNGDKEAQAVKAELQKKFLRAIKSGDMPTILYDENQLPEDKLKTEPSILKKILERENNRIRRKALERRGETVID